MGAYGAGSAKVYDVRWSSFAAGIAPLIHRCYEIVCPNGKKSLLDICCGTGQLSVFFLEKGYRVAGMDASEPMLSHARNHAADYVAAGKAQFITRRGLRRWNGISVDDTDDAMFVVNRGIYDGQADRAWARITGFVRAGKSILHCIRTMMVA
jgi:SAM-dependent methyltransferase